MHYELDAFGKFDKRTKKKLLTIQVKPACERLAYLCGQRLFFSHLDAQAVSERYGATDFPLYTKLDTRGWPRSRSTQAFPAVSDAAKGAVFYDIAVQGPAQVRSVSISTRSTKAGDCDLYVRRVPIFGEDDWTRPEHFASPLPGRREEWKSNKKGSNGSITISNGPLDAQAVRYLVMLHAYEAYEDVTLNVVLARS